MAKKVIDPQPIIEKLAARCLESRGLECSVLGSVIDMLKAAPDVTSKWIPVSERLPKTIPCDAGTEYSEAVNVLTSGRKVLTAIFDGTGFIADAEFWEAEGEEITHWTSVLLPLPETPMEGD